LEYTGGYEYRFLQFCDTKSIPYCRVPGLEIKQSMGMVRGKVTRLILSGSENMASKKGIA
jgi:hypothetical protein